MRKKRAKPLRLQDVEVHLDTDPDNIELIPQWFEDEQAANAIIQRLMGGDAWAWSTIIMRLTYRGIVSRPAAMPGCSFQDEEGFRRSAYFA